MASQRWHAARGRRLSSPHTCWHTWNGGERTTILCVLTNHYEWRSDSRVSEEANWRHNTTGNGLPRWLRAEPIDDGRRARCSRVPCRRLALERHRSQVGCCLMSWADG